MNPAAADTVPSNSADAKADCDLLSLQIQGLIGDAEPLEKTDERRARDRFPIPYMFHLVPISDDGKLRMDEMTTVVGKDISLSGVAFSHDHDLRCQRAVISLDHPMVGRFAVEAEIVWTRPTPIGLFESGCRLIRTVDGHTLSPKN
ncbi:MAG TPA: PilZ domain-containing protein [Lacipirellulaceae bacterium]|nr:PilZ domain-containing protein [Lacipirellulaceae bacterium]